MQRLYLACIVLSGLGMVAITLMIPSGVFMRYVMNDPLQVAGAASVIIMVFFSFRRRRRGLSRQPARSRSRR